MNKRQDHSMRKFIIICQFNIGIDWPFLCTLPKTGFPTLLIESVACHREGSYHTYGRTGGTCDILQANRQSVGIEIRMSIE
jgi:hypothetical protein